MEYNLRPQWSMWNNYTRLQPLCSKCGLYEQRFHRCNASSQKCFRCNKIGHFARMCWSKTKPHIPSPQAVRSTKSKSKKERDIKRLVQFHDKKNSLRELPFHSVRNSTIFRFFDRTSAVKVELNRANEQLRNHNVKIQALTNQLQSVMKENSVIKQELSKMKCEPSPEELLNKIRQLSEKVSVFQQEKEQNDNFVRIITEQHKLLALQEYEQSLELKQLKSANQKHLDTIQEIQLNLQNTSEELYRARSNRQRNYDSRSGHFKNNRGRFR